jgi:hypothetical protein
MAVLPHQAGIYTGRILNGEKPADLPVEQAAKIELTLNLKNGQGARPDHPGSAVGDRDQVIEYEILAAQNNLATTAATGHKRRLKANAPAAGRPRQRTPPAAKVASGSGQQRGLRCTPTQRNG